MKNNLKCHNCKEKIDIKKGYYLFHEHYYCCVCFENVLIAKRSENDLGSVKGHWIYEKNN